MTKEQAERIAERQRAARERQAQAHARRMAWAEYESPRCEAVRRAYPDCELFHEEPEDPPSWLYRYSKCPYRELERRWDDFFGARTVLDTSCACPQTEGWLGFPIPVERCVVPEGY